MVRRFNAPPNDRDFGQRLLDELNTFAGHGQIVAQSLSDSIFSAGYTSDPSSPATVYLPAFRCPPAGRWKVLDAHLVASTDKAQVLVGPYFKVEPSLRIEGSTRSLGTFSQRSNKLAAGVAFTMLSVPTGTLIPTNGVLELKVSVYGFPASSLRDVGATWRIVNTGG